MKNRFYVATLDYFWMSIGYLQMLDVSTFLRLKTKWNRVQFWFWAKIFLTVIQLTWIPTFHIWRSWYMKIISLNLVMEMKRKSVPIMAVFWCGVCRNYRSSVGRPNQDVWCKKCHAVMLDVGIQVSWVYGVELRSKIVQLRIINYFIQFSVSGAVNGLQISFQLFDGNVFSRWL